MNNVCCDPWDAIGVIAGTTKDVYNAGVDLGFIHGDRIGSSSKVKRSLLFNNPNYDDNSNDNQTVINITYNNDEDYDNFDWEKLAREATEDASKDIVAMESKGYTFK